MIESTDNSSIAAASPRFFNKRRLMILGIFSSSIPTAAVVIAFPVANVYYESSWNSFRTDWESRGETFDLESLYDTPVPDADNFAKAPIIAEMYAGGHDHDHEHDHGAHEGKPARLETLTYFSGGNLVMPDSAPPQNLRSGTPVDLSVYLPESVRKEGVAPAKGVLEALAPFDAVLNDLLAAADRPDSYFPVSEDGPFANRLPHMPPFITALHGLRVQTLAMIESPEIPSKDAARRVRGLIRTIRHGTDCPGLASCVVRTLAFENGGIETVWQALHRRRFDDSDWESIARELSDFEIGPRLMHSLRYERAALVWKVETDFSQARSFAVPPAWTDLAGLREYSEITQRHWFTDPAGRSILRDWPSLDQFAVTEAIAAATPKESGNFVLLSGIHSVHDFSRHAQWIEDQRDHALIAIALERHRLAAGSYPDRLSVLSPKWLAELPVHRSTGHPPRYELKDEGQSYRLRAMGENNGEGDAVWLMPTPQNTAAAPR
jgi:hypothetical protein